MDALNHSYVALCERLAIIPVLIPNALADPVTLCLELGISGVILTGGNDVQLPDETLGPATAAPRRDGQERQVLDFALAADLPVLGICRGLQFLNVYFGGGLSYGPRTPNGGLLPHVATQHRVELTTAAIRQRLGASFMVVNSYHNDYVLSDQLAPPLSAFAVCAADGVVEGVNHRTKQVLGLQWHPERAGSDIERDNLLLQGFLDGSLWHDEPRA